MKISVLKSIIVSSIMLISIISFGQETKGELGNEKVQNDEVKNDSTQLEKLVLVSLKDGREVVGVIIMQDLDKIILKMENNTEITIPWDQVSSITNIDKGDVNQDGVYLKPNLQSTRYFFGPNGHGLKKGEGYYQNVWIFFNQVSVGVTNNFSISAGMVPAFLFAGTPTPVWIIPKVSIPVVEDVVSVGVGGLFGTVIGDGTSFGIGFGSITLGNRNHNFSVSAGYGMSEGEWSKNPVITISGMTRISSKTYLLTENFIFPENVTLLSFGARSFAGKVGFDYGLFIPIVASNSETYAIPWLGITIPFGNY